MATISMRKVVLYDRWPGPVNPKQGIPPNGFDSTVQGSGNCVTTAAFPAGEKIAVYNDGTINPGWSTMCYMQFVEGSGSAYDAAAPSTGYGACFHCEATQHHPNGSVTETWYAVTHDLTHSDGSYGGPVAFPCCDLSGADTTTTGAEYGWFWIGGVCPCVTGPNRTDCTRLGGEMLTDGNVVAGSPLFVQDDGTNAAEVALMTADATKHMMGMIGWSLVVDA